MYNKNKTFNIVDMEGSKNKQPKKTTRVQTGFRLRGDLLERLQTEADKNNRTRNNMLEVILDKNLPGKEID